MKKRSIILSTIVVLLFFLVTLLPTINVSAASATVTDIANPDTYTCGQSGYINFEPMPDGTNLSSGAIDGVQFTTTNGFTWRVGDFATGNYNGKYPAGAYTSQGTHWAWLGETQGYGRIDFVEGPTSYISLLVSVGSSSVWLDAYDANNVLITTAGPASINTSTGHMYELKIVRDIPDIAYVIVHDSGNYFLVDSVCTNAPGVPNQSLFDYKQNKNADGSDVPWATDHLYDLNTCGTMAGYGCAITSLTNIIDSYGVSTLPNGETTNPGTLNHFFGLASNPGTHTGCYILWANAGRAVNTTIRDYRPPSTSYSERIARIDEALNANNLVILGIPQGGGKHFIVLYQRGPDAPDGSPDYYIADPYRYRPYSSGDRSGMTLYQAYNVSLQQIASSFQIEVVENQAPQPGTSWVIVARSPVEMLITDPNGLQSGFDPVTNSYMLDIPDSSYGPEEGIVDPPNEYPPLPHVLYFGQNQLEDGIYKIEVIGTGAGSYTLDIAIANGPMDGSLRSISGVTEPGTIDTYFVSVVEGELVDVHLVATENVSWMPIVMKF